MSEDKGLDHCLKCGKEFMYEVGGGDAGHRCTLEKCMTLDNSPIPGASITKSENLTLGVEDIRVVPGFDGNVYVFLKMDGNDNWRGIGVPPILALAVTEAVVQACKGLDLFGESVIPMGSDPNGLQGKGN